jgi:hypothetical protein
MQKRVHLQCLERGILNGFLVNTILVEVSLYVGRQLSEYLLYSIIDVGEMYRKLILKA